MLLFGAGHVGRAVVLALAPLPFTVRWIDGRPDQFPQHVPQNVVTIRTDGPTRELAQAPRDAMVIVMTHSHPLDFDITAAALQRDAFDFVGLIGSETKRARFVSWARQVGVAESRIDWLVCPIGMPQIKGKEPAVIAAGIAAQLLIVQGAGIRTAGQPGNAAGVSAPARHRHAVSASTRSTSASAAAFSAAAISEASMPLRTIATISSRRSRARADTAR